MKKKSNPDEHKRSIRFKAKSIEEMEKLASIRGTTVSDIVREYVEKGLAINAYQQETDLITEIIRQEIREALEPQINRIIKILMKIGKASAGSMYVNFNLLQQIAQDQGATILPSIERSLRQGVEYMKKKDVEVDAYFGSAMEVLKDSEKV